MAEFDVAAAFTLLTNKTQKIADGVSALAPLVPIRKNLGTTNTPLTGITTQTLIIPQAPSAGRMWFIHKVGILGVDGHTAVAGMVADVYTGPGQEVDPAGQIYAGLTAPTIVIEGQYHNPVLFGERVYAICYGVPANQSLQFIVGIQDYPAPATLSYGV